MLQVDSLDAYYGKSHILHDVSLSVDSNEIVALLGRNGAGKSTTCKSIVGVLDHVEGEITLDGTSLTGRPAHEIFRRGISWVPEDRRIFPNLTVAENVRAGVKRDTGFFSRDGDVGDVTEHVYDTFPALAEKRNAKARHLSGGQQQMLALGRAMASEPSVIVIDEPFEGLMPSLVSDVKETLAEMGTSQDVSMLLTDQRTSDTLDLADQAYIVEDGRIVTSGDAEEIRADDEAQREYLGVVHNG